jgi:hypothetical protein
MTESGHAPNRYSITSSAMASKRQNGLPLLKLVGKHSRQAKHQSFYGNPPVSAAAEAQLCR